jgi:hypothetical protein
MFFTFTFSGHDALVLWVPKDVRTAKGFMQYNLAVCHATRCEHNKASNILKEVLFFVIHSMNNWS